MHRDWRSKARYAVFLGAGLVPTLATAPSGCASRGLDEGDVADTDGTTSSGEFPCEDDCNDVCFGWGGTCVDGTCQCEDPCADDGCCGMVGASGEQLRCTGEPDCWDDSDCDTGTYCDGFACAPIPLPIACPYGPSQLKLQYGLPAMGLDAKASVIALAPTASSNGAVFWSDGKGLYDVDGNCVWPEGACGAATILRLEHADSDNDGIEEIRVWGTPDSMSSPVELYFLRWDGALSQGEVWLGTDAPLLIAAGGATSGAYDTAIVGATKMLRFVSSDGTASEVSEISEAVCVSRHGSSEVIFELGQGQIFTYEDTLWGTPGFSLEAWSELQPHSVAAWDGLFRGAPVLTLAAQRNGVAAQVLLRQDTNWVDNDFIALPGNVLAARVGAFGPGTDTAVALMLDDGTVRTTYLSKTPDQPCEILTQSFDPAQPEKVAIDYFAGEKQDFGDLVVLDLSSQTLTIYE